MIFILDYKTNGYLTDNAIQPFLNLIISVWRYLLNIYLEHYQEPVKWALKISGFQEVTFFYLKTLTVRYYSVNTSHEYFNDNQKLRYNKYHRYFD